MNVCIQFREHVPQPKRKWVRRAMIARRVAYLNGDWLQRDDGSMSRAPTPDEIADAQKLGANIGANWAARKRGIL